MILDIANNDVNTDQKLSNTEKTDKIPFKLRLKQKSLTGRYRTFNYEQARLQTGI